MTPEHEAEVSPHVAACDEQFSNCLLFTLNHKFLGCLGGFCTAQLRLDSKPTHVVIGVKIYPHPSSEEPHLF